MSDQVDRTKEVASLRSIPAPHWTVYDDTEFGHRLSIIGGYLPLIHFGERRLASDGQLEAETVSWAFHLESVPTHYLSKCIERATQRWKSEYPMPASVVLAEYDSIKEELAAGYGPAADAAAIPTNSNMMLPPGYDAPWTINEYLRAEDWKIIHDLPKDWRPGVPYPARSDLKNARIPPVYTFFPGPRLDPYGPRFEELPKGRRTSARWFRSVRAPWEVYPQKEAPSEQEYKRKKERRDADGYRHYDIVRVRVISWCERCQTIDFPGTECPGYVSEYMVTTEEGAAPVTRERRHPCPLHPTTTTGGK